ncbi:MAG: nucleoside 2-deoxyribosyltransferase domain-containing protein [Patescibacteria group bacterium]
MSAELLRPPVYHAKPLRCEPLVFTAGPIQGTADWQEEAIRMLQVAWPTTHIACPRSSIWEKSMTPNERDYLFEQQVRWEHYYLNHALRHGVVLFWLAPEMQHFPERAYAQTTRFELGFVLGSALAMKSVGFNRDYPLPLVVGIHPQFSNRSYLRKTLAYHAVPTYDALEDTVEAVGVVIDLLRK